MSFKTSASISYCGAKLEDMSSVTWTFLVAALHIVVVGSASSKTLECHQRPYAFRVVQADAQGKQCWDTLSVESCWGRCDSNEISDWRFPFKKSYHPVCVHARRIKRVIQLGHCENGAAPGTEMYVYLEADGCKCQACSSTNTSCEGVHHRGQRTHAMAMMAHGEGNAIFD